MKINLHRLALSVLTGILVFLSFPKPNLWFLAWIALVPLLFAIRELDFKRSFFFGWFSGLTAFSTVLYWIVPTYQAAGVPTIVGILSIALLAGYIAIYYGLFAGIFGTFERRFSRIPFLILSTALWVTLEWIRTWLFTGFPWGLIGYSQWKVYPLIQISEWTGVYGVSAMIVTTNLSFYEIFKTGFKNKSAWITAAIFILSPVILNFGLFIHQKRSAISNQTVSVFLLQGNIDQYKKWSREFEQEILNSYEGLSDEAAKTIADSKSEADRSLVIWPETAVPGWVPQEKWLMDWLEKVILKTNAYHLVGAVTKESQKSANAAFLFSPDGKVLGHYDKMHLVPFGEFVPMQSFLGKWISVLNELGGFDSGEETTILQTPRAFIGTTICYEAIFPELVSERVRMGANVLVNLTNDGWYLDTAAPEQHFAMNVFRAVENRRTVIRCANTGISGVIRPDGSLSKVTRLNKRTLLADQIHPSEEKTFYTRFGGIFVCLCAASALAGTIAIFLYPKQKEIA